MVIFNSYFDITRGYSAGFWMISLAHFTQKPPCNWIPEEVWSGCGQEEEGSQRGLGQSQPFLDQFPIQTEQQPFKKIINEIGKLPNPTRKV